MAQVEIEVAIERRQLADIHAFAQPPQRRETRWITVARDIKTAQGWEEIEGGEMIGREPGDQGQHGFEWEHGLDVFASGESVAGGAKHMPLPSRWPMARRGSAMGAFAGRCWSSQVR